MLKNELVIQYVTTYPTQHNPDLKPRVYDLRALTLPNG